MAIFKEFMHCVNTLHFVSHSHILHLFQFAGEMSNSHIHKFPQNNLYSYIIADSLRKIRISENKGKIIVQRLIYQSVN
jgi:hypothetical protein